MSLSYYKHVWHLTPNGWVKQEDRPEDAVETWVETGKQQSIKAPEYFEHDQVWVKDGATPEELGALRSQFNAPFLNSPPSSFKAGTCTSFSDVGP